MKRKQFLLLLCFAFLLVSEFSFAQTKTGIKSIKETSVDSKGKELPKSFEAYDPQGNLTEEIQYDDDGKIKVHEKYEFNKANQKVKETHFLPNGNIDEVATYEYDAKGNKVLKTVTDGSGRVKSKKKFTYEYY